jgi:hypothetical protein
MRKILSGNKHARPSRKWLLSALLLTLSGCGNAGEELAVDKLSKEQMQSAPVLALNADKPGAAVEVQKYVVPGKFTLIEFYSPYSPECAGLAASLASLPSVYNYVTVRTVNINRPGSQGIDWQSPAAQRAGVTTLPYFLIYEPSQTLRAHGRPAYEQVQQWIRAPRTNSAQYVNR